MENHLKREGPYHDNKCPNCPLRFNLRANLLYHRKTEKHFSLCCGKCPEVLPTKNQVQEHRATVHFGKTKLLL